jgi:pimeloyl-ACP methyl ester carboxylesterase
MSSSPTHLPVPEGPGSASGAPHLPEGFTGMFTSRYIDAGEVCLHVVAGGEGPPLLLVHGWPETWYYWRLVMPALARDFSVVAVDQRGTGLSGKPEDGYDTGTAAGDLVVLMEALGHQRFAMAGVDTGMPIAYALAADHRDRLDRLAVGEAVIAGVTPSPPLFGPAPLNNAFWHIPFNRLTELNEQLVRGREELYFGFQFAKGGHPLPGYAEKYYIDMLTSGPHALRGSFGQYRAWDTSSAQNAQRKNRRLTLPVLAMGGAKGIGQPVVDSMKLVADDVQGLIIPDCGHWLAEEAPDQLVTALTAFLAPYRDGLAAASNSGPRAAGG